MAPRAGNPAKRFWSHVEKGPRCWKWTASIATNGYGCFSYGGRKGHRIAAHRFSWLLDGRQLVTGLDLDHLCRNRACVRPDHLEQVTRRENLLRGANPRISAYRRGECLRGHKTTPYVQCRECRDAWRKEYREKNKDKIRAQQRIRNERYAARQKERKANNGS
jgi:hypothetical protein